LYENLSLLSATLSVFSKSVHSKCCSAIKSAKQWESAPLSVTNSKFHHHQYQAAHPGL